MPNISVIFKKEVDSEARDNLNQHGFYIFRDRDWEDQKMDELYPLIEEWKINYLILSKFIITKPTSINLWSFTKSSTSSFLN